MRLKMFALILAITLSASVAIGTSHSVKAQVACPPFAAFTLAPPLTGTVYVQRAGVLGIEEMPNTISSRLRLITVTYTVLGTAEQSLAVLTCP